MLTNSDTYPSIEKFIPFNRRGEFTITNFDQAKLAAINLRDHL